MSASCRSSTSQPRLEWLGTADYLATWQRQRELATARADAGPDAEDVVLLLEHPSVYTAGRRTSQEERPTGGTPVIDVDRGGKITWHGPGQLVGYPIVGLAEPYDVVDYVRRLEQALISVVAGLGVPCGRSPGRGRAGVWLAAGAGRPERKIAAIGVRVQRGVTMHGFALNCEPDLSAYDQIVPCGITDAGITSLTAELGRQVTVDEVLPLVSQAVPAALDGQLPVTECTISRPPELAAPGVTLALDPVLTR